MQRENNRALEERIQELLGLSEQAVCRDEGRLYGTAPGEAGLTPLETRPGALTPPLHELPAPVDEATAGGPQSTSLVSLLDTATALIIAADPAEEGIGMGTGFFITPNHIVTNLHVISDPPRPEIFVVSPSLSEPTRATVVARSPNHDIGKPDFAVLSLPGAGSPTTLSLVEGATRLDNVIAAGFPGVVTQTDENFARLMSGDFSAIPTVSFTEGIVTAIQNPSGSELILHSAAVSPGNSGGPLVDRCGRVVGVNTFVISEETYRRVNYALSAAELGHFLDANGLTAKIATAPCALPASPSPSDAGIPAPSAPSDGAAE